MELLTVTFCSTQRVLRHGLSLVGESSVSDEEDAERSCCSVASRRSKRKQKQPTSPDAGPTSPSEILGMYRAKSKATSRRRTCPHCDSERSNRAEGDDACRRDTDAPVQDELEIAEEGMMNIDLGENLCPICIEPFQVGEGVAWSRLGHCRHAFHYDCLLPWLVMGHTLCPVCREEYWSKDGPCIFILCLRNGVQARAAAREMRRSTFCVQHGLVSPTRNVNSDS